MPKFSLSQFDKNVSRQEFSLYAKEILASPNYIWPTYTSHLVESEPFVALLAYAGFPRRNSKEMKSSQVIILAHVMTFLP